MFRMCLTSLTSRFQDKVLASHRVRLGSVRRALRLRLIHRTHRTSHGRILPLSSSSVWKGSCPSWNTRRICTIFVNERWSPWGKNANRCCHQSHSDATRACPGSQRSRTADMTLGARGSEERRGRHAGGSRRLRLSPRC